MDILPYTQHKMDECQKTCYVHPSSAKYQSENPQSITLLWMSLFRLASFIFYPFSCRVLAGKIEHVQWPRKTQQNTILHDNNAHCPRKNKYSRSPYFTSVPYPRCIYRCLRCVRSETFLKCENFTNQIRFPIGVSK